MGNATHGILKRRWITLISAGWVPHYIVTSRSCLDLGTGIIRKGRPHSSFEGSPHRVPRIALPIRCGADQFIGISSSVLSVQAWIVIC